MIDPIMELYGWRGLDPLPEMKKRHSLGPILKQERMRGLGSIIKAVLDENCREARNRNDILAIGREW